MGASEVPCENAGDIISGANSLSALYFVLLVDTGGQRERYQSAD